MSKQAFQQASQFFLDAVEQIQPGQWNNPALGVWDVRDLVGHASRALGTLVNTRQSRRTQLR